MADDWGYFGSGSSGYGHYMTAFHRNNGGGGGGGGGKKPPNNNQNNQPPIWLIMIVAVFIGYFLTK